MVMDKKEKEAYKKELKKYERLGAVKFQKLVLQVEETKFKIMKKLFPNFIHWFDKYCDWKQKRALKGSKTDEERKKIKDQMKLAKMAMRKEWNEEKNRNYHINPKHPTEMIRFLEWNKDVHKRGLITNGILIPIIIAGIVFHIPGTIPLLVFECLSAAVNFECINIQNYNLCRMRRIEPMLAKREEASIERDIEEFGEAAEVIHNSIEKSESLPSFDEIISNIDNIDQLRQMREMFKKEHNEREAQKKIGGF